MSVDVERVSFKRDKDGKLVPFPRKPQQNPPIVGRKPQQ